MLPLDNLVAPFFLAPVFAGLSPRQLKVLALEAERLDLADGEVLIREDEIGDATYLVVAGEVERLGTDADGVPSRPVGCGTVVGEMAMLVETVHSSTVVARGKVQALRFSRAAMHEIMQRDPSLAEHFVDVLRRQLAGLAQKLREVEVVLEGAGQWQAANAPMSLQ